MTNRLPRVLLAAIMMSNRPFKCACAADAGEAERRGSSGDCRRLPHGSTLQCELKWIEILRVVGSNAGSGLELRALFF